MTTYIPSSPWTNGQLVTRNDGVLFVYSSSLNALSVVPNTSGSQKNANGFLVTDLPAPVNNNDAANKYYVDTHVGGGGGIADAPSDGNTYVRLNAAWTFTLDAGSY